MVLELWLVYRHEALVHLPFELNKFLAEDARPRGPSTLDTHGKQLPLAINLRLNLLRLVWFLSPKCRLMTLEFEKEQLVPCQPIEPPRQLREPDQLRKRRVVKDQKQDVDLFDHRPPGLRVISHSFLALARNTIESLWLDLCL